MLNSDARTRVLDAAEQLFSERGYASVKLKDIAEAVGIRHATLYHHVPGGKEALYLEVTERTLLRHRQGLDAIMQKHDGDLRAQLFGIADWLLSHPPMDFIRMVKSDMIELDPSKTLYLSQLALDSMIGPIARVLYAAQARGEVEHTDLGLVAGGLFGMFESLHLIPEGVFQKSRSEMIGQLLDAFLYGVMKR